MPLTILKHQCFKNTEGYITHHIIISNDPEDKEKIFNLIDANILSIYEGTDENFNVQYVKIKLKEFWNKQTKDNQKGMVAEFFTHLFVKALNFEQQCCLKNLEEGSMKKGFDGVYLKNEELWYMESKSGDLTSDKQHFHSLRTAIVDIEKKITTKIPNDPWANAFQHAKSVNAKKSIKDKFIELSLNFTNNNLPNFNDFNIIPSSTIFIENCLDVKPFDINKIQTRHSEIKAKNHTLVCCTHNLLALFSEYLDRN